MAPPLRVDGREAATRSGVPMSYFDKHESTWTAQGYSKKEHRTMHAWQRCSQSHCVVGTFGRCSHFFPKEHIDPVMIETSAKLAGGSEGVAAPRPWQRQSRCRTSMAPRVASRCRAPAEKANRSSTDSSKARSPRPCDVSGKRCSNEKNAKPARSGPANRAGPRATAHQQGRPRGCEGFTRGRTLVGCPTV